MSKEQIYKAFGDAIATRRRQMKLTQNGLAKKTGMSRASIANIERGRQNVALHHIYSLAGSLEVARVSDLLPAMTKPTKREEETMITLDTPVTPKVHAQANDFMNSILGQSAKKKSES
ncbi:transcriptional regulator [Rhodobacteraceae bacterium 4F10]|jgi:transcriptional regulator with XRE-family HTH domain|nr:transcriptional regulator [Rhodobacteraceae bacterium 4F10]